MLFLYFAVLIIIYFWAFIVAIFCEYPFRNLVKVIICPEKKIIRLKKDLAKQLKQMYGTGSDSDGEDDKSKIMDEMRKTYINPSSSEEISDREQLMFRRKKVNAD